MNILLTGGTGTIGRMLYRYWLARNKALKKQHIHQGQHQLWVLSRKPERVPQECGKGVNGIGSVKNLDEQNIYIDAIINLAGVPIADKHWTNAREKRSPQAGLISRTGWLNGLVAG